MLSDTLCPPIMTSPTPKENNGLSASPNSDFTDETGLQQDDAGSVHGGSDGVGHTTESIVERDPDYLEDRFRVDRRKLEQLIQGECLNIM